MLVSIVIPVRNDTAALRALLAQLPPQPDVQVVVSHGGPADGALAAERTARPDVTWVDGPPSRGPQLNSGAAGARGRWLWFLHADSRLPDGWLDRFRELDRAGDAVVGGSFGFRLDSAAWQARVLERGVAWRVRRMGLPYGDQGLFVRRTVFERMGGFAPVPLMEDVDFVVRLKREGRLRHLTEGVVTSARRWERDGWWRRTASNLVTLGLWALGASPEWLARRYYRE